MAQEITFFILPRSCCQRRRSTWSTSPWTPRRHRGRSPPPRSGPQTSWSWTPAWIPLGTGVWCRYPIEQIEQSRIVFLSLKFLSYKVNEILFGKKLLDSWVRLQALRNPLNCVAQVLIGPKLPPKKPKGGSIF